MDFRWSHFASDVSFVGADFGSVKELRLTGLRSDKLFRLDWGQWKNRMTSGVATSSEEEHVYLTLLESFRRSGDLDSENECFYAWKEWFHPNRFWKFLWGYGVRPLHTLVCLTVVFVAIVISNADLLQRRSPGTFSTSERWWQASRVAFETSGVTLPPLKYAAGIRWKVLLIVEWLVLKTLQVFFLVACSNTSPVLKELVPKLLPG